MKKIRYLFWRIYERFIAVPRRDRAKRARFAAFCREHGYTRTKDGWKRT